MKLLPCPFCGSDDIKTQSGTGLDLMTQYNGRYVYCVNCGVFMQVQRYSEWNNRTPIYEKGEQTMKKAEAQIEIQMNVECPYCGEYINIFDISEFPRLNEEGYLARKALGETFGCENINEPVQCPECKKVFIVSNICW